MNPLNPQFNQRATYFRACDRQVAACWETFGPDRRPWRAALLRVVIPILACSWVAVDRPTLAAQEQQDSRFPKFAALLASGAAEVKIACIGDSITGVYYHTGGRRAYPEIIQIALQRAYPKAKVAVINAGISGNTLPQGLARLERDVLGHKPQLVTIMYGMNDLTRSSIAEFKKNVTDMVRRCQSQNALVLLCTQNSIYDGARSSKKLAEFTQAIHEVGRQHNIPVADCHAAYEEVRARDVQAWSLLMSDAIHPNMAGHKLFARVIARAITGRDDTLDDVGPPAPALPRTLAFLQAGKTVKVLAMPPYDALIGPALRQVVSAARVEVTAWPTEGQTLAQIEAAAKKVRGLGMNLVIVAVPPWADAEGTEHFIRSYSWVLNSSLSFGRQEWDVLAVPPSTHAPNLSPQEKQRDQLCRRLIAAQDLSMLTRAEQDTAPLADVLARWLRDHLARARASGNK